MKDILIVAQYTQAPGEFENDRFKYLAEMMLKRGDVQIEVVTMDFSHHRKEPRHVTAEQLASWPYSMTFLHVAPYRKNVSVQRLLSNRMMANNLQKYLALRKKPDVVFCAVPSVAAAKVAAEYCKQHGVKFVIDIQDLWPEAFRMSLNIPVVSDVLFAPMARMADYVYQTADTICAVSETYIQRARKVNNKIGKDYRVFLGTDLADFDQYAIQNKAEVPGEIKLCYCGTIGRSYDLTCVIDALARIKADGYDKITFIVLGDGPDLHRMKEYAETSGIQAKFYGRLPYAQMCGILTECDIVVNPIIPGASQSIINKHADYAASGLPVVNTQECIEYRKLVDEYQMGFNCPNNDAQSLAEKIRLLAEDS